MAAPRQPKGNPTLSDDARTELQRKELDALHNKLAKRGIDDGKRRDLFRATEVPGGFEGRLALLPKTLFRPQQIVVRTVPQPQHLAQIGAKWRSFRQ